MLLLLAGNKEVALNMITIPITVLSNATTNIARHNPIVSRTNGRPLGYLLKSSGVSSWPSTLEASLSALGAVASPLVLAV